MKFLVVAVIAALCVAAVQSKITDEQAAKLEELSGECKKETKVEQGLVDDVKKGDVAAASDSTEFKSFAICLAKKLKLLSESGDVQKDVAMSYLPADEDKDKSDASLSKCAEISGDSDENTQFLRALCIYKEFAHILP